MTNKISFHYKLKYLFALIMAGFMLLTTTILFAMSSMTMVSGRIYEFDEDNNYEFSDSNNYQETGLNKTYGTLFVGGEIADITIKNGTPTYEVNSGSLSIYYNYGDKLLNTSDLDNWHLVADNGKKVDSIKLDEKIQKGVIILQTSTDGLNWIDAVNITDAFNKTPIRTEPIYETSDMQLINGCYYRLIVAYELRIRTEDSNFLFVNTDKFNNKKCVEVYEFFAFTDTNNGDTDTSTETYKLGTKVRVEDFDSYFGEEPITKEDSHYGWDLGEFFVSGYTDKVKDSDGNMVFLKNIGDKVTLWFRLGHDINKLNGNDKLSITPDKTGSDQYFETPTLDFGRGVLIVRYTDYNNVKSEPTIYTNYLEANTSVGADTKVQLFEEGDYEVALDYQITEDQLIDKIGHYRIFFKFSIRNGNCMVFPFDVETGNELTNSSMTENGFRLDLAKSRYLKVNLKRETLTESTDGLVEDTRFNGPARDGASYTDDGIYTITVTNEYTGQSTTKKIYVGTNNVLRAHMTTGLSISEINDLVNKGAKITDEGIIELSDFIDSNPAVEESTKILEPTTAPDTESEKEPASVDSGQSKSTPILVVFAVIVVIAAIGINILKKKKNHQNNNEEEISMEEIKDETIN